MGKGAYGSDLNITVTTFTVAPVTMEITIREDPKKTGRDASRSAVGGPVSGSVS